MSDETRPDITSIFFIGILIGIVFLSFLPAFLTKNKQTTSTFAAVSCDSWKSPGNQCSSCGVNGWWDQGCWDWCTTHSCAQTQGACSPCGDISLYCKNSQQGSCIKNGYRCGNDSCGHADSSCGEVATSTPVPTAIPTTIVSPTSGPSPTAGPSPSPSPSTSPSTTTEPTQTPCVTEVPRTNDSGPMNLVVGLFDILINGTNVNSPCSTGLTPTPIPSGTAPTPTRVPNIDASDIYIFVQNVKTYCDGRLIKTNINCLNSFSLDPNLKSYLVNSVNNYGCAQCADTVKGIIAMTTGVMIGEVKSAINWWNNPPVTSNYTFDKIKRGEGSPQFGDVAIWSYGVYGHAGFVTRYDTGGNTFEIVEANYDGSSFECKGGIRISDKSAKTNTELMGWLRLRKL